MDFSSYIGATYFENLFGTKFSADFNKFLFNSDLCYRPALADEVDAHLIEAIRWLIDQPINRKSGPDRKPDWENGWYQNLLEFQESLDISSLLPYYYRKPSRIVRYGGEYIVPKHVDFESRLLNVMHFAIAEAVAPRFDCIVELGAGPCHNVLGIAKFCRKPMSFFVSDWVSETGRIVELVRASMDKLGPVFNMHRFCDLGQIDFFSPKGLSKVIPAASLVLTWGSLEQIGTNHKQLLNELLSSAAQEFLHIEPFIELYDDSRLFDFLAKQYSLKRGYLEGYLPSLEQEERKGVLSIVRKERGPGSAFHDGWSMVNWVRR